MKSAGKTIFKGLTAMVLTAMMLFGMLERNPSEAFADTPAGVVKLGSDTITYTSYYNESRQIPCDALGGIYFLNENKLSFYSVDNRTTKLVYTFQSKEYYEDAFVAGQKLYVLESFYSNGEKSSYITIYNLSQQKVERTITYAKSCSAIGADSSGRIYLAGSDDSEYHIYLLSASGQLLSQAASQNTIYRFSGFDSTNGNFYVESYANWVYWGYDHDMNALRAGNVSGNKITFQEDVLFFVCQSYFYERQNQVELLGNKYLCTDNTFNSGLSVWNSNQYSVTKAKDTQVLFLERDNKETGDFDPLAATGTRTVYRKSSASIVTFKNNSYIAEYDLKTGKEVASMKTAHPVFSLMEYKGGIAAVEKDGNNFYLEYFPWKAATSIKVTGNASKMNIGASATLTATSNGDLKESYTWKSSNPKIVSVNQSGRVFAWHSGSAVITVTTKKGLTAKYKITVTSKSNIKTPSKKAIKTKGTATSNASRNNYTVWGSTVNSYLAQNSDGTLTRVEYDGKNIIIETYSLSGTKKSSKKLKPELGLFGGFYSGSSYNYIVYGQNNPTDSDQKEVMRVVKYSKSWKKISSLSIKGSNTYSPFSAGSLRMTENKGKLYIYTCHEMYKSSDGLHHQSNMTFVINESSWKVEQSYYDVMNIAQAGYVSHSFNQFIRTDGSDIYRVDHGDAYPRAISITKCKVGGSITDVRYTLPVSLSNVTGYNDTGASVGGFELSSQGCLIAGNAVDYTKKNASSGGVRNVFISITDKELEGSKVIWLTKYTSKSNITVCTPQLVKIGNDEFFVAWEEYNTKTNQVYTTMLTIDSNGTKTSKVIKNKMRLSDCQPIRCSDGVLRWYTTDSAAPVLYALNPLNLDAADANIANATVGKISNRAYTGKTIRPGVKVTMNGTTLKRGQDYTISYKNNKKTGKATITITGKGNYFGSVRKYFNIVPKKTAIASLTSPKAGRMKITWKKNSQASGYQIVYANNAKFNSGKHTLTVGKKSTTSKIISKLKRGKTYYVKIRPYKVIDGKRVYGSYSKVKKIKIR